MINRLVRDNYSNRLVIVQKLRHKCLSKKKKKGTHTDTGVVPSLVALAALLAEVKAIPILPGRGCNMDNRVRSSTGKSYQARLK